MNATPPSGHRRIRSARPPTDRHARAWPISWSSTIPNNDMYSATFQTSDEYFRPPYADSINATMIHVQWR